MGLGWDEALDMIDYRTADRETTFARARQLPRVVRESGSSREVRRVQDDVLPFFDVVRLEVEDELDVDDGRFSIDIVAAGDGEVVADAGSRAVKHGDTFACASAFERRYRAGREPLTVIRCLGPSIGA